MKTIHIWYADGTQADWRFGLNLTLPETLRWATTMGSISSWVVLPCE